MAKAEPSTADLFGIVEKGFTILFGEFQKTHTQIELVNNQLTILTQEQKAIKNIQSIMSDDLEKIKEDLSSITGVLYEHTEQIETLNKQTAKLEEKVA